MRISCVEIENFRSIRHLALDFGEITVFIGPNNAGKTAILDAIQLALPQYIEQRRKRFNEYDIHLKNDTVDPKNSDGASITLTGVEEESTIEDLGDIIQLDFSNTNRQSATIRTQYKWDGDTFEQNWEFLDAQGEQLVGTSSANRTNLNKFRRYLPVFYLGALRTVNDEVSPRSSQFWRRLIEAVKIPADTESKTLEELNRLNEQVLKADPHLEQITQTLKRATEIAVQGQEGGNVSLQALPSSISEILSKVQIILRNEETSPWLPIRYQGEGMQSLLVLFLFQAFVESLLDELYGTGCEPILLLEEPETHLHPHAARTLWKHIQQIPGQKIITTHSPYFIQHVPFRDLRLVRHSASGTEVLSLPENFSAEVPPCSALEEIIEKSNVKLSDRKSLKMLTVAGNLDKDTYRKLLGCYGEHKDQTTAEKAISDLKNRSSLYVPDKVLRSLEIQARRMRGEIFFAKGWMIVEGQTDFVIMHAVAHALDRDLDKYGISVIDAQNNGSPSSFARLARALNIPWQAVFDGDRAGKSYIEGIKNEGFEDTQINGQCHTHEAGDLEHQLIADGYDSDLREILVKLNVSNTQNLVKQELLSQMKNKKLDYAAIFAERIRNGHLSVAEGQLTAFQTAIRNLLSAVH